MEISKLTSGTFDSVLPTKSLGKVDPLQGMGKTFEDVIQSLTDSQNKSDDLTTRLAAGEDVDIQDVLLAQDENDINFRVAMGIRGKLVEAYRSIISMPV
jgi:flagellar hook-basal body complex protein FliE